MRGYPLLDAFLTIFWLFIWIMWIFLLIRVISDVFRSHDLTGAGKAGWTLVLIVFPLIGVLAYLLVRGNGLHERENRQALASEEAMRQYLNRIAGPARQHRRRAHPARGASRSRGPHRRRVPAPEDQGARLSLPAPSR